MWVWTVTVFHWGSSVSSANYWHHKPLLFTFEMNIYIYIYDITHFNRKQLLACTLIQMCQVLHWFVHSFTYLFKKSNLYLSEIWPFEELYKLSLNIFFEDVETKLFVSTPNSTLNKPVGNGSPGSSPPERWRPSGGWIPMDYGGLWSFCAEQDGTGRAKSVDAQPFLMRHKRFLKRISRNKNGFGTF